MNTYEEARRLVLPSVHLNGTSKGELEAQYRSMHEGISVAIKELSEAAPHPRDYYVQGDGAFDAARAKHRERVNRLNELLQEIENDYLNFMRLFPGR
jgi:hypothetical protein